MKRLVLFLPVVLAACAPLQVFDKQGVSVARLNSDLQACTAKATEAAPRDVQVFYDYERVYRPRYYNGYRSGFGWEWERTRDIVDVNEAKRLELRDACMVSRGYTPGALPRCQGAPQITTAYRQPAARENSCAVKLGNAGAVIVTPAPAPAQ